MMEIGEINSAIGWGSIERIYRECIQNLVHRSQKCVAEITSKHKKISERLSIECPS